MKPLPRPLLDYSGIYSISISRPNGVMYYVGQAKKLRQRRREHLSALRCGTHFNARLQTSFNKYGEHCFDFSVLLVCPLDAELLTLYEQKILDSFDRSVLFNMRKECVATQLGVIKTKETRLKISNTKKLRRQRDPSIIRSVQKIAGSLRGRKRLPHVMEKLRQANLGRKWSNEQREKQRLSSVGRKRPLAAVIATANANRGQKRSPEVGIKIAAKTRGRKWGAEERAKILAARTAPAVAWKYRLPKNPERRAQVLRIRRLLAWS